VNYSVLIGVFNGGARQILSATVKYPGQQLILLPICMKLLKIPREVELNANQYADQSNYTLYIAQKETMLRYPGKNDPLDVY